MTTRPRKLLAGVIGAALLWSLSACSSSGTAVTRDDMLTLLGESMNQITSVAIQERVTQYQTDSTDIRETETRNIKLDLSDRGTPRALYEVAASSDPATVFVGNTAYAQSTDGEWTSSDGAYPSCLPKNDPCWRSMLGGEYEQAITNQGDDEVDGTAATHYTLEAPQVAEETHSYTYYTDLWLDANNRIIKTVAVSYIKDAKNPYQRIETYYWGYGQDFEIPVPPGTEVEGDDATDDAGVDTGEPAGTDDATDGGDAGDEPTSNDADAGGGDDSGETPEAEPTE